MVPNGTDSVQPPFDSPPHVVHPTGAILVWFTEPAGAVIQLAKPTHLNAELAQWMSDATVPTLKSRYPGTKLYSVVVDRTLMLSRDSEARKIFLRIAPILAPARVRICLLLPPDASPMLINSVRVLMALAAPFGVDAQIEKSLTKAVSNYGLRAASIRTA